MPAAMLVEDLEIFEDLVGQFDAGGPGLALAQLDLHAAAQRVDDGVVMAVADRTHRRQQAQV